MSDEIDKKIDENIEKEPSLNTLLQCALLNNNTIEVTAIVFK